MWWHDPRILLLRALLLDWLGQCLIVAGLMCWPEWISTSDYHAYQLDFHWLWFIFCLTVYPLLGWLFGSYTVLRWRRLALHVLFQRLFITSSTTLMVVAFVRWLVNPVNEVWLVHRHVLVVWLGILTVWSFLGRIALRRGLLLNDSPRLLLLADNEELNLILPAWRRVLLHQRLEPISQNDLQHLLNHGVQPLLVALSPSARNDLFFSGLLERLEIQDPRIVQTISVISLFEKQQERLPPVLLAESSLSYDDLPWAAPFSVQAQLKRLADLFVAAALLLLTAPFVLIAALLIWLEDQGPVFFIASNEVVG